jgi:hypothetical protein
MWKRSGATALATLCLLLGAAANGQASRGIGYDPDGGRYTAVGAITFAGGLGGCTVTVNGTFGLTQKVVGATGGTLTSMTASRCNANTNAVVFDTSRATVGYQSFTGALPAPSSVLYVVRGVETLVTMLGSIRCLFTGPIGVSFSPPSTLTWLTATLTSVGASLTHGLLCPTSSTVSAATMAVTPAFSFVLLG